VPKQQCDIGKILKGCNKKAVILIEVSEVNGEKRFFCLKHGIAHITLMLLNNRKRSFVVTQKPKGFDFSKGFE